MKKLYVLRTNNDDGTSHNDFQWPQEIGAIAKAPDWEPSDKCGKGLHGLLFGKGDGSLLDWEPEAHWMVVEVLASDGEEPKEGTDYVDLEEQIKFRSGSVSHIGDQKSATDFMVQRCLKQGVVPNDIVGATITVGHKESAIVGYRGAATAGNQGTATAGDYGTATTGDKGAATAGYGGTATAGYGGTATTGNRGTATAGSYGTATTGDYGTAKAGTEGTATAGYFGTATAGYFGTATAGYKGTATAGNHGTATAGVDGTIYIDFYNIRLRTLIGYIGETLDKDGNVLEPNVAYKVEDEKFVKAT